MAINSVVILLVLTLATWITPSLGILSQKPLQLRGSFVPTSTNCSNLQLVHLINFLPCIDGSSPADLGRCDVFIYVAMKLAVERINANPTLLSNTELKLAPVSNVATTGPELNLRLDPLIEALRIITIDKQIKTTLWGFVGPLTASQADSALDSVISLENAGTMMVSYSIREVSLNNPRNYQSTFYRSLPSESTISSAIVSLLGAFQWLRFGLIHDTTLLYSQMAFNFGDFISTTNKLSGGENKRRRLTVEYTGEIPDLKHLEFLDDLRLRDIRIIVGFFGPVEARTILCEAKQHGLTTADHVWILPAYYNPDWWKSSPQDMNSTENGCTDDEMLEILNKLVIFIDGIKFPTLDLSMSRFYSELINKTRQLFPSLRDVDLSRYLQHSRATSAYDAVMLLARSLDAVVDRGGDLCHDPLTIQTALERCLIGCELCRLFSSNSSYNIAALNGTDCEQCQDQASYCDLDSTTTFEDLRSTETLDLYGQVLVSQFINGTSCPLSLYWPHCDQTEGELVRIAKLAEHPCAGQGRVGLDRNTSFKGIRQCPMEFQWKGGSLPRSNNEAFSYIPTSQFAPIAALTVIGMILGVVLITLHIIWKEKKQIKVTSPRLNIIFVIGFFIQLPSQTIYDSLITSANVYNITESFHTPLCQVQIWPLEIGTVLMLATLLVKNWRIHRIFHNRELKEIKSWKLADGTLIVVILVIALPTLVLLSIWTAVSPYVYQEVELKDRFRVLTLTFCGSQQSDVWNYAILAYHLFLIIILFILGLSAAKVPSMYAGDGKASQRMVLLSAVVLAIFIVVQVMLGFNPHMWLLEWWMSLIWSLCLPVALMLMLLLPPVCLVIADDVRKKKDKAAAEKEESSMITDRYSALLEESINLKSYLSQIDEEVTELKRLSSIIEESTEPRAHKQQLPAN